MPSCQLFSQSGGIQLVSGNIYSGSYLDIGRGYPACNQGREGGVQLRLSRSAPGPIYVGVPWLSGIGTTILSGGSLSSGGLNDGMELNASESYFMPRSRLVSGIETILIGVPASSSGGVLFWELQ